MSAAIAARGRWRFSQRSVLSGSSVAAATSANTLVAMGRRKTDAPRGFGSELVATDDPGRLVAGVQHEVQSGRRDPDQGLHAVLVAKLCSTAIGHVGQEYTRPLCWSETS